MAKLIIALLFVGAAANELTGMHEQLIGNMLLGNKKSTETSHPVMAWLNNGDRHSHMEYALLQRTVDEDDGPEKSINFAKGGSVAHGTRESGPVAEIYPDVTSEDKTPDESATVELTRFVTPYKTGLEAFVDVTKFSPIFSAADSEHKIVLHKIANCTQCGIDWCSTGFELDEKDVESKAFKVGERLSKWSCTKLNSGPVRKPWKNSETGVMYVAEATPILTMYGMIDTWVSNNDTKKYSYYLNNKTDKCYEMQTDDGQGWSLSADLVFFHGDDKQSVKPKEVISLASGYFSTVKIGTISDHSAKITAGDKKVHLDKAIDITGVTEAVVYGCKEGPGKILENAVASYIARKSEIEWQKSGNNIAEMKQEFEQFLISGELHQVYASEDEAPEGSFVATYDSALVKAEVGLPVYYSNVITEQIMQDANGKDTPWNMTYPFQPVGEVKSVDTLAHKMVIQMNHSCYPTTIKNPHVKMTIPSSKGAFDKIQQFVSDAMDLGKLQAAVDFGASSASDQERFQLPTQDRLGKLALPTPTPYIADDNALPNAVPVPKSGHPIIQQIFEFDDGQDSADAEAGDVCVVAQRKHGQVISKKFDLPLKETGDRVLANIAVTGHGWEYTQEQCGEYCDIKYSLKFNNGEAINLTQWRDDCKSNPTGADQHGTWDESRNGWCPGTVEPGAIVDVTDHLNSTKGDQSVTLDVLVYSKDSGKYEPFSNIKGWIFGDKSILKISLSLHVYSKKSYQNAMGRFTRCSAAESAMHHEGKVYGDETPATHKSLLALNRKLMEKTTEEAPKSNPIKRSLKVITDVSQDTQVEATPKAEGESPWNEGASCWNFQKTKPWYTMHKTGLDELVTKGKATRVPVIDKAYMESHNRYMTVPLNLDAMKDKEFTQVGLIFKLEKPSGMQYDHWDRVGSVGLEFPKSTASAHVHSKSEGKPMPSDPALVDPNWAGAHSLTAISGVLISLLAFFA